MKVIISHDVDHITVWEHKKDLMIPKFIMRSLIESFLGYLPEAPIRFESIIQNKWHNLEELMNFDRENKIPATYFVGIANGMGLSYSLKDAEFWIKKILQEGFDVGVHGIAFNNYDDIKAEYEVFRNLSGLSKFGIRMHYLRNSENMLTFLNEAGYLFDATSYRFENPSKIGHLWEFPLHVMDVYVFCKDKRWQVNTLSQSKEFIKTKIEKAYDRGLKYFTILFHDSYFSDAFKTRKEWYIWLIRYLKENGSSFISYTEAIHELRDFNE